jgi:hypothetical protein
MVLVWAWLVFWSARPVFFAVSGPVVPIKVVECPFSSGRQGSCTGVWQPPGEPEKKVTIYGRRAFPDETVNARIHGDEAWALEKGEIEKKASHLAFLGIGGLFVMVVFLVALAPRKPPPRPNAPNFWL